jgi:5-methylcytosine-specific restriction protein A
MKFSELYGPDVGGDFIHVHHREPIAEASGEYIVDPVRDLVPVCPNCHYMLHTDAPPLRPEFLRDIVEARRLPADGQSLPES